MAMAAPLWKGAFDLEVKLWLYEDNETAYRIFKHGRNPTMWYLGRTHGVSLGYLVDRLNAKDSGMQIKKAESSAQRADILTKCFGVKEWKRVRNNINIFSPEEREGLWDGTREVPYTGNEDVKVPYLEEASTWQVIHDPVEREVQQVVDSDQEEEFDAWNWIDYDGVHDSQESFGGINTQGTRGPSTHVVCAEYDEPEVLRLAVARSVTATPPCACAMRRQNSVQNEVSRKICWLSYTTLWQKFSG